MSALLLTVVILGVCVAAVVVDLLGGSDQPATGIAEPHRDYGGPWTRWLRAGRERAVAAGHRGSALARSAGRAAKGAARGTAAGSKAGGEALRQSLEAVGARRRALAERHAAHARYVAHLEAEAPPTPPPYPLPPPAGEVDPEPGPPATDDHTAPGDPWGPPPAPPPTEPADLEPGPAPEGPWGPPPAPPPTEPVEPGPAGGPADPGQGGVTDLRPRQPVRSGTPRGGRRQAPDRPQEAPRPGGGRVATASRPAVPRSAVAPLTAPWAVRVRSAVLLVGMMGVLGVVTALVVLGVVFVIVEALAGL